MKRWQASLGVLVAAFSVLLSSLPAYALYGRAMNTGYFTGVSATSGDFLFSNGAPANLGSRAGMPNVTDAASFISLMESRLNGSNVQDQVGAAFIIDTMVGQNGTNFGTTDAGIAWARQHLTSAVPGYGISWEQLVNYYAQQGQVDWDVTYNYPAGFLNSFYAYPSSAAPAGDDVFYNQSDPESEFSIIFKDANMQPVFIIKKNCGNVSGYAGPLPVPTGAAIVEGLKIQSNQATGTASDFGNAAITLHTGSSPNVKSTDSCASASDTCNPFTFGQTTAPASGQVAYTISAQSTINGWNVTGWQWQRNGGAWASGSGSSFSFNISNGDKVDVRFIYSKGGLVIQGLKVDTNNNPNGGTFSGASVSVTGKGTQTAQPFTFAGLAPGNYGVTAQGSIPDSNGTWYLKSWRWCDGTYSTASTPPANCHDGTGQTLTISNATDGHQYNIRFIYQLQSLAVVLHKIFGANGFNLIPSYVRDNFQFAFQLLGYLWPDAGCKGNTCPQTHTDASTNLWLAGIWGDTNWGGNAQSDSSPNADINCMGLNAPCNGVATLAGQAKINARAETGCPAASPGCLQRVPLAYVPQSDGNPATKSIGGSAADYGTTPNGNNWLSIRLGRYSAGAGGSDTSCVPSIGYYAKCGGMASNNISANVGGYTGTHLKQVEISDIHVTASGFNNTFSGDPTNQNGQVWQGGVPPTNIQISDWGNLQAPTSSLPNGSQGPTVNCTPSTCAGVWDNVRNPNKTNSGFSINQGSTNLNFDLFGGGYGNFTQDPANMSSLPGMQAYANGTATSLLQDNHDAGYHAISEPLSLTGGVQSATNVNLAWNEYVNWNQVDDKGHWYTTQSSVPTGAYWGPDTPQNVTLVSSVSGGYETWTTCYNYQWEDINGQWQFVPTSSYPCPSNTYTCNSYATSASANYNPVTYYTNTSQTRYGWLNTTAYQTGSVPYGSPGSTAASYYAGYTTSNPPWATNSVTDFWQDLAVTPGMLSAGSMNPPAHTSSWRYDQSDPVYNNRQLFINPTTVNIPNGVVYGYSTFCYWTGTGGSATTYPATVDGVYPSQGLLYENSTSESGAYVGQYNFSYDGQEDGTVDTGWAWSSNPERVQYEQTFTGHTRNLGSRSLISQAQAGSLNCADPNSNNDTYFLGEIYYNGQPGNSCMLPSRGIATIYNPTISAASGDIYGAAGVDSYFSSSAVSSAFVFSNGNITRFNGGSAYYPSYNFNTDQPRTRVNYPGSPDPAHYVFKHLDDMVSGATTISSQSGINSNLGGATYVTTGDLHLSNLLICSGSGTVIVRGDLYIDGPVAYNTACSPATKSSVPSIGFIVMGNGGSGSGNIYVDKSVQNLSGAYFANSGFYDGSVLLGPPPSYTPNNDRAASDTPFALQGLIVADNIQVQRQLSGAAMAAGQQPETFVYDSRIVANPPPGFSDLFGATAVWNEAVPYN